MDHILSIVLFTPLVGLLVLLFLPSSNARAIKLWANVVAFVGFLVSLPLVFNFDHTQDYQFEEKAQWIPSLGATYHLGIDGLGLLLGAAVPSVVERARNQAVGQCGCLRGLPGFPAPGIQLRPHTGLPVRS